MSEQTTVALKTIFSEVLANLAFMFSDDDSCAPPVDAEWIETTISHHGPVNGTLTLNCRPAFATQLATNLLGKEPSEGATVAESHDAVKEFMNVVCGQLITELFGTEAVFNLSIPTVQALDAAPGVRSENDGDDFCAVSIDGEVLQLSYVRDAGSADSGVQD